MANEEEQKPQVAEWASGRVSREIKFLGTLGLRSYRDAEGALNAYEELQSGEKIITMCAQGVKKIYGEGDFVFYLQYELGLSPKNSARFMRYLKKKNSSGDSAALQMIKDLGWI